MEAKITRIPFRRVNRRGQPDYCPDMQRHHLLPSQLMKMSSLAAMFAAIGQTRQRFDDFRANGLLLPCRSQAAKRTGMPLHRGLHRHYNAMVAERVGQIEAGWYRSATKDQAKARLDAMMRLALLQKALRRRLLVRGPRPFLLNRKDPFRAELDFSTLDAMAEGLWRSSAPEADSGSFFEQR